jgi:hypothetical protein
MWAFAGGSPQEFAFYYHYHYVRRHDLAMNFFAEYKGYIRCDGFPG